MAIAPLVAIADPPGGMGGPRSGALEQLNLTETQRQQLRDIQESSRSQIEAVLTSEQRQQLETRRAEMEQRRAEMANLTPEQRQQLRRDRMEPGDRPGGPGRGPRPEPFAELNLTDSQRQQIRQIMETARDRSQSVLTAEQRQQLETLRQNRGDRRGPRGGASMPGMDE
ncbi:MAG: hypothetical protein Fur0046_35210 [Cyanobacteria bacterium J069]|nr:MAG: P pilus assembly/Cpx signaling pathway, periplasmic inhibitor/zinc-resistance associated protein [Cyanobacteria bacterium J069]